MYFIDLINPYRTHSESKYGEVYTKNAVGQLHGAVVDYRVRIASLSASSSLLVAAAAASPAASLTMT